MRADVKILHFYGKYKPWSKDGSVHAVAVPLVYLWRVLSARNASDAAAIFARFDIASEDGFRGEVREVFLGLNTMPATEAKDADAHREPIGRGLDPPAAPLQQSGSTLSAILDQVGEL